MAKNLPVHIAPGAELDLLMIHDFIARDKIKAAKKWLRDIKSRIRSIGAMPLQFEIIPEAEELDVTFRHFIFGNYRVIYKVETDRIVILRVVHAARILHHRLLSEKPEDSL